MAKQIKELTLQTLGSMAGKEHKEYVDDNLVMAMSAVHFGKNFMHTGQPYRVVDGRIIRAISGKAHSLINMKPYNLSEGSILVIPPNSVMEIEEMDEEYDFQICSFRNLPDDITFKECTFFQLKDDDWNLTGEYYQLLRHTINRKPFSMASVRAIQAALLLELRNILEKESVEKTYKVGRRKEEIFHKFTDLIKEHATTEHNIKFYADRLFLTPNHLGSTIREASGMTVLAWIHRHIIQQAKLQLMYSNLPVSEIAEQLHFSTSSAFCKFFKKETKMTPSEYREESIRQ